MTDIYLIKRSTGLVPASENDNEALKKFKSGEPLRCKISRPRNYQFHKKYWALVNHAFDCFEPEGVEVPAFLSERGIVPEKNLERFRKDLTILAGYFDSSIRVNGEVRQEAKSISFGSMSQDDFDELYDKTISVILKYVLKNYTKDDLEQVVEEIMGFC